MFNEINITVEHFAKLLNGTKYLYRKRMHIAKFRSLVTPPLREHIAKKNLVPLMLFWYVGNSHLKNSQLSSCFV